MVNDQAMMSVADGKANISVLEEEATRLRAVRISRDSLEKYQRRGPLNDSCVSQNQVMRLRFWGDRVSRLGGMLQWSQRLMHRSVVCSI